MEWAVEHLGDHVWEEHREHGREEMAGIALGRLLTAARHDRWLRTA